jgi:hypothetical protein
MKYRTAIQQNGELIMYYKITLIVFISLIYSLSINIAYCDRSDSTSAWGSSDSTSDGDRSDIESAWGSSDSTSDGDRSDTESAWHFGSSDPSRSGIPAIDYDFIASIYPANQFRNNYIYINFNITNKNSKNSKNVIKSLKIRGNLFQNFRILNNSSSDIKAYSFIDTSACPEYTEFLINCKDLYPRDSRNFNYTVYIANDTKLGLNKIFDDSDLRFECNQPKGRNVFLDLTPTVFISNNNPNILLVNVSMPLDQVIHIDNDTLMLANPDEDNYINLKVNAIDIEDKSLNCSLTALELNNEKNKIELFAFNRSEATFRIASLNKGKYYVFKVRATDKDGNYSEQNISIYTLDHNYKKLVIPNIGQVEIVSILLSTIITIAISILLLILHPKNENILNKSIKLYSTYRIYSIIFFLSKRMASSINKLLGDAKFFISIVFLIWCLYFIFLGISPLNLPILSTITGSPLFFSSLPFFYLFVYFTIFYIILYFNEICFSPQDRRITQEIRFMNSVVMLFVIIYMMVFIPRNSSYIVDHLHYYYSSVAQIFATIFTLVVTLSTQFPRNILNPGNDCRCQPYFDKVR